MARTLGYEPNLPPINRSRRERGLTYARDRVVSVPLEPPAEPFKIVVGHLPDNPRRLVKMFVEELRAYFQGDEAQQLTTNS